MNSVYLTDHSKKNRNSKKAKHVILLFSLLATLFGSFVSAAAVSAQPQKSEAWDVVKWFACSDAVNSIPILGEKGIPKKIYQETQTSDAEFALFSKSSMGADNNDVSGGLNAILEYVNTSQGGKSFTERNEAILGGVALDGSREGDQANWNKGQKVNPYDRFGFAGLRFTSYAGEWKHLFVDACADPEDVSKIGDTTVNTSPDTSLVMSVASWNVCAGACADALLALSKSETGKYLWPSENFAWSFRAALGARREIAELRPDIIGLQEAGSGKNETDTVLLPDYESTGSTHPVRIYYKADKFEVVKSGVDRFSTKISACSSKPKDKWTAWAHMKVKDGREFGFISIHTLVDDSSCATSNDGPRKQQVERAIQIAKKEFEGIPVIIVGDMNSARNKSLSGPEDALKEAGYREVYDDKLAQDIFDADYDTYQGKAFTTGKLEKNSTHIDQIWVSPIAGPEQSGPYQGVGQYRIYSRGGFPPSDHALVYSTINLSGPYVARNGDPNDPRTNLFYDTRLEPRSTWDDRMKSIDPRTMQFSEGFFLRFIRAWMTNLTNTIFDATKIIVGLTIALIGLAFSDVVSLLGINKVVTGTSGDGGLFKSLYESFFLPLTILAFVATGAHVAWQGLVKRAFRNALGGLIRALACFLIAVIIAANPAWFIALPNNVAVVGQSLVASVLNQGLIGGSDLCDSNVGGEINPVTHGDGGDFEAPTGAPAGNYVDPNAKVRTDPEEAQGFLTEASLNMQSAIGCSLWNVFLFTPWVEGQFGTTYDKLNMDTLGNRNGAPKASGKKAWVGEPEVPMGGGTTIKNWALFQISTQTNAHSAYGKPAELSAYSQGVAHDWWRIVDAISNYQEEPKDLKIDIPTGPVSGGGSGGDGADLTVDGDWTMPVPGGESTKFGTPGSLWSIGWHTGTDFHAAMGESVYSAGAGTVTQAGWNGAYGNQVRVNHGGGVSTTYSHLSKISVSKGKIVKAGSLLGKVGSTGNSTGPHMHMEMNVPCGTAGAKSVYGECKIDAYKFLKGKGATFGKVTEGGGSGGGAPAGKSVWDRLAECESGGNWAANTGNGYYGGLQFSLATWRAMGGSGYPHQASKAKQIEIATKLQKQSGWGQWPACSKKLGLTDADLPDSDAGGGEQGTITKTITYDAPMDAAVLDPWDQWVGNSPTSRLFTALSSLLVAGFGIIAPLLFASLSAVYAIGIAILMAFAPIFFLLGCWAGRGQELFKAWADLVLNTMIKRIAVGILMIVSIALTATIIQLMQSQGWWKGVILLAVSSFALWKARGKILNSVAFVNFASADLSSTARRISTGIGRTSKGAGQIGAAITVGGIQGARYGGSGSAVKNFGGGALAAFRGEAEKLSYRNRAVRSAYLSAQNTYNEKHGISKYEAAVCDCGECPGDPLLGHEIYEGPGGHVMIREHAEMLMERNALDANGYLLVTQRVRASEEFRKAPTIYEDPILQRSFITVDRARTFDAGGRVKIGEDGTPIKASHAERVEALERLVAATADEIQRYSVRSATSATRKGKRKPPPRLPQELVDYVDAALIDRAWELGDADAKQAIKAQYASGWIARAEAAGLKLTNEERQQLLVIALESDGHGWTGYRG